MINVVFAVRTVLRFSVFCSVFPSVDVEKFMLLLRNVAYS